MTAAEAAVAPSPIVDRFTRFLDRCARTAVIEAYQRAVAGVGESYNRSLVVNVWDIAAHDLDLAEELARRPLQCLPALNEALKSIDCPIDPRPILNIRLSMSTRDAATNQLGVKPYGPCDLTIPRLGSHHLNQLVTIRGIVKKMEERIAEVRDAVFQCRRCGCYIREPQEVENILREPTACSEEQGGCGKDSKFTLILGEQAGHKSSMVDKQRITMTQLPEETVAGLGAQTIDVWMDDDAIDKVRPGERLRLTGTLRLLPKRKGNIQTRRMERFLEVVGIDKEEDLSEDTLTSEAELRLMEQLSRHPDFERHLIDSMTEGRVHGYFDVLKSMVLSLIGGHRSPGERHQSHVALIGDPSTAKTLIARLLMRFSPRHILATGGNSTKAGMTMAAVQGEDGRWTLEAGAFLMATLGILVIDEAQLISSDEKQALNEGMQNQTISKNAAGVQATVPTDTTVWMILNPVHGRFDPNEAFAEQFDIPANTLSRFDYIWVFRDIPNRERDSRISRVRTRNRYRPGVQAVSIPLSPCPCGASATLDLGVTHMCVRCSTRFLRKYLQRARDVQVTASDEVMQAIDEAFVDLRVPLVIEKKVQESMVNVTPRHEESLYRAAEGNAKLHLREAMTIGDVEEAVRLFKSWVLTTTDGKPDDRRPMDLDGTTLGMTSDQRQLLSTIRETIATLTAGRTEGATAAEIKAAMHHTPAERIEKALARLSLQREIYQTATAHGGWRLA